MQHFQKFGNLGRGLLELLQIDHKAKSKEVAVVKIELGVGVDQEVEQVA